MKDNLYYVPVIVIRADPAAKAIDSNWQGSMTLTQLEAIEQIFAMRNEFGWTIPDWLTSLRVKIMLCNAKRARGIYDTAVTPLLR